jgi:hypothetical protein
VDQFICMMNNILKNALCEDMDIDPTHNSKSNDDNNNPNLLRLIEVKKTLSEIRQYSLTLQKQILTDCDSVKNNMIINLKVDNQS